MIPVIISAAAYKLYKDRHKKNSREETFTRYLSEEEVPPDVLEKIKDKCRARLAKEKD